MVIHGLECRCGLRWCGGKPAAEAWAEAQTSDEGRAVIDEAGP